MDMARAREALLWSAGINDGILLGWCGWLVFAHDQLYDPHGKWFKIRDTSLAIPERNAIFSAIAMLNCDHFIA